MPKMKSRRSAVKRFKLTASGKIKREKAFHSHLLSGKSPRRKRSLVAPTLVSSADIKRVRRMILA